MSRAAEFQLIVVLALLLGVACAGYGQAPTISIVSKECIACHVSVTPAIVADWRKSRHASVTPVEALKQPEKQRRVSAEKIPDNLVSVVVACAECHTLNAEAHKDSFDHNDQRTHLLVTPRDCSTCHPTEASEYDKNMMSHALGNLDKNEVFQNLMKSVNGMQTLKDTKTAITEPDDKTSAESCYSCHGTSVEVKGMEKRDTDFGEMTFPSLKGWPNQGVGRFNTDGSRGSCSACHPRHQFAIQMARKPYACAQCHKSPDVPADRVYTVSKHGNLFSALYGEWNFTAVPWTVGKDFTGPTCAACHASLLVTAEGDVAAPRTHQMNERLPWRIFGLPYAHAHPVSPDTSKIRNKDGAPLPTALDGTPAANFLISPEEQTKRREAIQKVCRSCHGRDWVAGHWERFENTIKTSNEMTLTATKILLKAWDEKVADPKPSMFDESIEKPWTEQWLFHANSTRFASAMMGPDFGVFDGGRWSMAKNIQDMLDHLKFLLESKAKKTSGKD